MSPMMTYNELSGLADDDPLKTLTSGKTPDVIEVGERNDCWMQVRRSKKVLELVDKVTGNVKATIPIDQHFAHVAADRHQLKPRQITAAQDVMKLKSTSYGR
jgi:hypothetical protein